jgi:hypothetical protein
MKATRQQLLAEIDSLKCELERYREIAALYRISLGDCAANRILSKLPRRSDSENHNPILPSAFRK